MRRNKDLQLVHGIIIEREMKTSNWPLNRAKLHDYAAPQCNRKTKKAAKGYVRWRKQDRYWLSDQRARTRTGDALCTISGSLTRKSIRHAFCLHIEKIACLMMGELNRKFSPSLQPN